MREVDPGEGGVCRKKKKQTWDFREKSTLQVYREAPHLQRASSLEYDGKLEGALERL